MSASQPFIDFWPASHDWLEHIEWFHKSWFWLGLKVRNIDNVVAGLVEDALMDAVSDQCDAYIDITPFPGLSRVGL